MVGLSIVLEAHNLKNNATSTTKKTFLPLVLSKSTMATPPPAHLASSGATARSFHQPPAVGGSFLDACFLCRQRLLPGKDIYMYKGDKAFCSEECRSKQMLMDEYQEQNPNYYDYHHNHPPNYNNNHNNSNLELFEKSPNYNYAAAASSSSFASADKPRHQRQSR